VRHVLEGSVRREGDEVRVAVQLIDSRTGYHVWAGNFDRSWRDVLLLQDEVARSVMDALQLVLASGRVAGPAASPSTIDSRALEPYLEGLAYLRQPGDPSVLQRAETAFRAAVAIAPELTGAHAGLCRVLARRFDQTRDRGALEQAERSCRRSLELDASLVDTEKALAGLYVSDGRHAEAIDAYRKVLTGHPRDADAHLGLGEALAGLGQTQEAEASLREAVAVDPSYWRAYAALGGFMFQRGRVDEAIGAYRRSTELVPSSASAWNSLGGALQLKGDFAGAETAFQKSLLLEPGKNAYSNLATIQFSAGNFVDAVRNYERAVALGAHDHIVRGNLADALWQIPGRRDEAAQTYRQAIELAEAELAGTPSDPTLRAQLGYYYGRAGDPERSALYLEQATRHGAGLLYVQYYRGVAAADRGDRSMALAAVADLVQLGYPPALLRSAPEFRSLLRDAEYKKIVDST
jgi:tetratricopeptide (TPR) repeat protein